MKYFCIFPVQFFSLILPLLAQQKNYRSSWAPEIISLDNKREIQGTYYATDPQGLLTSSASSFSKNYNRRFFLDLDEVSSRSENPSDFVSHLFDAVKDILLQSSSSLYNYSNTQGEVDSDQHEATDDVQGNFSQESEDYTGQQGIPGAVSLDEMPGPTKDSILVSEQTRRPYQSRFKHHASDVTFNLPYSPPPRKGIIQREKQALPNIRQSGGHVLRTEVGTRNNPSLQYGPLNINVHQNQGEVMFEGRGKNSQPLAPSSIQNEGPKGIEPVRLPEKQERHNLSRSPLSGVHNIKDGYDWQKKPPVAESNNNNSEIPENQIREAIDLVARFAQSQVKNKRAQPAQNGGSTRFSIVPSIEFIPMPNVVDEILKNPIKNIRNVQSHPNIYPGSNWRGNVFQNTPSQPSYTPESPEQNLQFPAQQSNNDRRPLSVNYGSLRSPPKTSYQVPSLQPEPSYGEPLQPLKTSYGAAPQSPKTSYGITSQPLTPSYGAPSKPSNPSYEAPLQPLKFSYGQPSSADLPKNFYQAPSPTWTTYEVPSESPKPPYGSPPKSFYEAPSPTSKPSYGAPSPSPKPSYGAPSQSPKPSYGTPPKSFYEAPSLPSNPSYGVQSQPPKPSYGAPSTISRPSYGAPSQPQRPSYGIPLISSRPSYGAPSQPPQLDYIPQSPGISYGEPGSYQPATAGFGTIFGGSGNTNSLHSQKQQEKIKEFFTNLTARLVGKLMNKRERLEQLANSFKGLATRAVSKLRAKLERLRSLGGNVRILAGRVAVKINRKKEILGGIGNFAKSGVDLVVRNINARRALLERISNILKALGGGLTFAINAKRRKLERISNFLHNLARQQESTNHYGNSPPNVSGGYGGSKRNVRKISIQ